MPIQGVIFDIGGVIVDWNPVYLYRGLFGGDEARMAEFLTLICPQSWNEEQDAGRPIAEATEARVKQFPEWEKEIRAFYGRWIEMVKGPIPGTSGLIAELHALGLPLYALSNFSAELFPLIRHRFSAFDAMRRIFLSGDYKRIKPDARFYNAALAEIPAPREALFFVDDNPANVAGAEAVGLPARRFTDAVSLRSELKSRGVDLP